MQCTLCTMCCIKISEYTICLETKCILYTVQNSLTVIVLGSCLTVLGSCDTVLESCDCHHSRHTHSPEAKSVIAGNFRLSTLTPLTLDFLTREPTQKCNGKGLI